MSIVFNKKRCIIFTIISLIICALIIAFKGLFVVQENFQTLYFVASIIFTILIIPVQSFNIQINEKLNKWYSIILSLFSLAFICFIIELLNNNFIFNWTYIFNFLQYCK